jgi:hypothetical protein
MSTESKLEIMIPELLFKSSFIGMGFPGIHELTLKFNMKCDIDVKKGPVRLIYLIYYYF